MPVTATKKNATVASRAANAAPKSGPNSRMQTAPTAVHQRPRVGDRRAEHVRQQPVGDTAVSGAVRHRPHRAERRRVLALPRIATDQARQDVQQAQRDQRPARQLQRRLGRQPRRRLGRVALRRRQGRREGRRKGRRLHGSGVGSGADGGPRSGRLTRVTRRAPHRSTKRQPKLPWVLRRRAGACRLRDAPRAAPSSSGLAGAVAELLAELLDATGRVDDLLLAGIERMRLRRDLDLDERILTCRRS